MPSPKGTGAPLAPISILGPGTYGLNKQSTATVLDPKWAVDATNAIFDQSNRLASRKGWLNQTTSAISGAPVLDVLHEFIRKDATHTIISSGGSKVFTGVNTPTDITGAATITGGDNWQFFNFADVVIGVQDGEQPIRYTGTGTFADLVESDGTAPQGNCGLGAFGRVWITDSDKQTLKYSGLLDETKWLSGSAGAGLVDMTSVWPNGMDEITALAAYNGLLVIFGRNCITFWTDGTGSALGIDPANMYVADTLMGTGCIARDSIQQVDNGDILFLSSNGVQSLQRLIQEKSNPIFNVSGNVRDYLLGFVATEPVNEIRSAYSPSDGFYLLLLPHSKVTFCFDTRLKLPDGTYRVTEWRNNMKACVRSNDNSIYMSMSDIGGRIGKYAGYNDYTSALTAIPFTFQYNTGWLDLGEETASYIKILKSINGLFFSATAANTTQVSWSFDFSSNTHSKVISFVPQGAAEWGIGEWGIMEWAGGGGLRHFTVPSSGAGQFVQVGVTTPIDQNGFAIQQINLYAKIGRLAN